MEINDLRSIVTVISFLVFLGICAWAYSRGVSKGFDEAAHLPFTEDDLPAGALRQGKEGK